MKTPFIRSVSIVGLAALGLVACGDASDTNNQQPQQETTAAVEESQTATQELVDKAKEIVSGIRLDTSSAEAFKASLVEMKDSLSDEDKEKFKAAMKNLGKKAVSESGNLFESAKEVIKSGNAEDGLLKKFGDKLNDLNFEELLAFANE